VRDMFNRIWGKIDEMQQKREHLAYRFRMAVRELRSMGWTLDEIEKLIGINKCVWARWMNCKRLPKWTSKLCKAVNILEEQVGIERSKIQRTQKGV